SAPRRPSRRGSVPGGRAGNRRAGEARRPWPPSPWVECGHHSKPLQGCLARERSEPGSSDPPPNAPFLCFCSCTGRSIGCPNLEKSAALVLQGLRRRLGGSFEKGLISA